MALECFKNGWYKDSKEVTGRQTRGTDKEKEDLVYGAWMMPKRT
jgi:hypothetical protein